MDIEYLNIDLEIESSQDLSIIVEEFGEDVQVLFHGETQKYNMASFECDYPFLGADEAINHFCTLVENLPAAARKVWDACVSRVFDLGYRSGDTPNSFRTELRAPSLKRVAAIGASIVITIYPGELQKLDQSQSHG